MNAIQGPAPSETQRDTGAVGALVLGLVSLPGLFFPPLLVAGVISIVIGWTSHRRIAHSGGALKGKGLAITGMALGVVGCLLSLVFPGFIAYVYIYAAFHGGQTPWDSLP